MPHYISFVPTALNAGGLPFKPWDESAGLSYRTCHTALGLYANT